VCVQLTAVNVVLNAAGGMGVLSLVGDLIRQPQPWFGLTFVSKNCFQRSVYFGLWYSVARWPATVFLMNMLGVPSCSNWFLRTTDS